jgi:hypothetical protein
LRVPSLHSNRDLDPRRPLAKLVLSSAGGRTRGTRSYAPEGRKQLTGLEVQCAVPDTDTARVTGLMVVLPRKGQAKMRRWTGLLIAIAAFVGLVRASSSACWMPDQPATVLQCLQAALANRDVGGVEGLLADDFVAEWKPAEGNPAPADAASFASQFSKMWAAGAQVELATKGKITVENGEGADEWVVDCLEQELIVHTTGKSGAEVYTVGHPEVIYHVIRARDGGYLIRRIEIIA